MISKKAIAPTLAGTGAAGATGTLAWALGLFDGENQEDVVEKAQASASVKSSPRKTKVKPTRTITHVSNEFFTDKGQASDVDKQAINSSSTWEVKWNKGLGAIVVEAEEAGKENSWKCELKAISIEGIDSGQIFTEFERQTKELKGALENENNKKQFVANCSNTRLTVEKQGGKESKIELETENAGSWNKFKFKESEGYFKRLWTENFYGVDRMEDGDEWLLDKSNANEWSIKKEAETKVKVEISSGSKTWSCHISGDYEGNLGGKTFNEKKLREEILGLHKTVNKIEKKKYLIRNCRKNNWEIKGLTIQAAGRNEWEFSDLKEISEGMYENPIEVET